MDMGMDRVLGYAAAGGCIPGGGMADRPEEAADAEGAGGGGLELSLSLHPSPSSPPRFQAVFACCYCPRKFRSSQALGGHQNAHKLQRNLARRGRDATAPAPPPAPDQQGGGRQAVPGGSEGASAPPPPRSTARADHHPPGADAWGEQRRHHRRHHHFHHQGQPAAGGAEAAASSRGARADGDNAEEIIDLSLKL